MADGYPLKIHLAFCVLPGNIQHIGSDFTLYDFKTFQLIAIGISRFSINPSSVRQNGLLSGLHRPYRFESNVSLRRTSSWSVFVLQKDGQNLDGLERLLGRIRQL